jgi:hypothetical protein
VACDLLRRFSELTGSKWQARPDPASLLTCYSAFAARLHQFGAVERSILDALDLDMLADAAWWTRLVLAAAEPQPETAMHAEIAGVRSRLAILLSTLPKLSAVLDIAGERPADGPGMLLLRMITEPGQSSQPRRVSYAIEAISLLWEVTAALEGETTPLLLNECTPAPGTMLIFQGAPDVMTALKAVLVSLWEQVVVHHTLTNQEWAEQIPPLLPITRRIAASSLANTEDLQAKAREGLRLFLQTGASIPEMDNPVRFTPAGLLHASDAFLFPAQPRQTPGSDHAGSATAAFALDSEGLEALIAEERDQLAKESQRKKGQDRAPRSWVSKRPVE